jgi:hypothetical protein
MKSFNIWVILSFMSVFGLEIIKGQAPQKMSYQPLSRFPSASIDSTLTKLSGKLTVPDFGIADSFNCKLAILTIKPNHVTKGHNPPPKKKIKPYISNKSTVCDKWWYNLAGGLFNASMNSKYPARTVPKR